MLNTILWLTVTVLAAHGAGTLATRGLLDREEPSAYWLSKFFSVGIGLFLFSFLLFVCGLAGFLNKISVVALLGAGLALCAADKRLWWRVETSSLASFVRSWRALDWVLALGVLLLAAASFVGSQAPATANDALAYQLYFPKMHADLGALYHDPLHPRSLWPSAIGMIYTAGMILGGTALAQGYAWFLTAIAVLAVPCAAHYFYRERDATRAAVIFMAGIPAWWMQGMDAYTDTAIAFYAFLTFLGLWLWKLRGFRVRDGVAAGLCAAALASNKFFALVPLAVLAVLAFLWIVRDPATGGDKRRGLAAAAAVCVLFAAPWFVRSWILAGNPVFPFMNGLFGGEAVAQRMIGYAETPKSVLSYLSTPWNTAMRPDLYGGEPIGCLFLAATPLVLNLRRLPPMTKAALLFAFFFITAWFFTIQHARFLFAALPFLSLVFAVAFTREIERGDYLRPLLAALIALLVALHAAAGLYYPLKRVPAGLGLVPAEEYLEKNERSHAFMRRIAPLTGPDAKLLFAGEARLFYAPAEAHLFGPPAARRAAESGLGFAGWLKSEGFTHVVTMTPEPAAAFPEAVLEGTRAGAESFERVDAFSSPVEPKRHYALWKVR